jgi:hypothetical protein
MLTGRYEQASDDQCLGITEACADDLIVRRASVAGGLGACYAPSGERDGYPLGVEPPRKQAVTNVNQREARGAEPPR